MPGSCRSIAARECEAGRGAMKTAAVAEHYGSADIAERVLAALRAAMGPDAPATPDILSPFDHFLRRGLVATQQLAAHLALQPAQRVLDTGPTILAPVR